MTITCALSTHTPGPRLDKVKHQVTCMKCAVSPQLPVCTFSVGPSLHVLHETSVCQTNKCQNNITITAIAPFKRPWLQTSRYIAIAKTTTSNVLWISIICMCSANQIYVTESSYSATFEINASRKTSTAYLGTLNLKASQEHRQFLKLVIQIGIQIKVRISSSHCVDHS